MLHTVWVRGSREGSQGISPNLPSHSLRPCSVDSAGELQGTEVEIWSNQGWNICASDGFLVRGE